MTHELELIRRVIARDPDAEAAFVARYRGLVQGLARGRLGLGADQAEELMQVTFTRLWENDHRALRGWRGQGRFTTYLTVIVLRLGYRLASPTAPSVDVEPIAAVSADEAPAEDSPAEAARRREVRKWVRAALDRAPARDRLLLALRFFDGRAPVEIAALLGGTPGATRKAIHDALARLRRHLHHDQPELFPSARPGKTPARASRPATARDLPLDSPLTLATDRGDGEPP